MNKAINEISTNKDTALLLQEIQYNLKCCGWKNSDDYSKLNGQVPASCCGEDTFKKNQTAMCNKVDIKYNDGCKDKLHLEDVKTYLGSTLAVGIAVVLFEIILVFAACCLARDFRQ